MSQYEYYISRDFSVPMLQLWYRSEALEKPPYAQEAQPHRPYIVLERTVGTVKSYYDIEGKKWTGLQIIQTAQQQSGFLEELKREIEQGLQDIQPIYEHPRALSLPDLLSFFDSFEQVVPWAVAMWWLCGMSEEELQGIAISSIQALRERTDKLSSGTDVTIRLSLQELYPHLGEFAAMLTIEEIRSSKHPDIGELKKRDAGFILTDNTLFPGIAREEIEKRYSLSLPNEEVDSGVSEITGTVAYKGKVRGRVRLLMGHKEIGDVQEGEIIVSPMTMPDFLPAMEKAAAFITDEGGITCHAAIVAREMRKPCIVGTKIATHVLQNGDEVEVDANTGVVNILKK